MRRISLHLLGWCPCAATPKIRITAVVLMPPGFMWKHEQPHSLFTHTACDLFYLYLLFYFSWIRHDVHSNHISLFGIHRQTRSFTLTLALYSHLKVFLISLQTSICGSTCSELPLQILLGAPVLLSDSFNYTALRKNP